MTPSITSGALMLGGALLLGLLWKSGSLDGLIAGATSIVKAGPNVPKKSGIGGSTAGLK